MGKLVVLLVALAVAVPVAKEPDASYVMRLISYYGIAHGCPISSTTLLTSRHVATRERSTGLQAIPMIWADGRGETGSAWMLDYDVRRDLALMRLEPPVTQWYALAPQPPVIGERVMMAGFNLSGEMEPKVIHAKVTNVIGAHVVLSEKGLPGFSGTCVLNAQNEVIGIFQWAIGPPGEPPRSGVAGGVGGEGGGGGWLPPS